MSDIPASDRLCVFCAHMDFHAPRSYSEWTHENGRAGCDQGHWYLELVEFEDQYRFTILKARECPDFEMEGGIAKHLKGEGA